jgi:pilus assembly protein CpaD
MKLHPLFAVGIALTLSACLPAEYTDNEAPKNLTLDNASAHLDLRFAPGSSHLGARDAARLRAMAATGGVAPADRVTVAVGGSLALASARFDAIAAELLRYRIVATPRIPAPVGPNQAVIESERYLVTLPTCPNWSKFPAVRYANTFPSNFGCATAVNLGMIIASPADLVEGRSLAMADGQPAAAAVNRYLNERVQLPTAAAIGPLAAPSVQAPGGAAVGGTGSQQ